MKNNRSFFGLFLAILIFLPGCVHVPVYKSKSLQSMGTEFTYRQTEKDVILHVKKLTVPEIQYLFGTRNKQLIDSTGIIHLSLHNFSKTDYLVMPENITVKPVAYGDVIKLIKKTNTTSRFVGTAVSAFIGSPLLFNSWLFCIGTTDLPGVVVLPFIGAAVIAIPMGVIFLAEGIKSAVMNGRIKKDVKEKMIDKNIVVKSGQHYEGLIFVKSSDYQPTFTITIHEQQNRKNGIVFNVNLPFETNMRQ